MPTRRSAPRLTTLAVAALVALSGAACDEAVVEDAVTPSPVASRIDAASPPPASQVAIDNSLGDWRSGPILLDSTVEGSVIDACCTAPVSGFEEGAVVSQAPGRRATR